MSTIVVAAILVVSIILVCVVFIKIHRNAERKQKEDLLGDFYEEVAKKGFSVSSQELFKNRIFAVESANLALLYYDVQPQKRLQIIQFDDVNHCAVTKKYNS